MKLNIILKVNTFIILSICSYGANPCIEETQSKGSSGNTSLDYLIQEDFEIVSATYTYTISNSFGQTQTRSTTISISKDASLEETFEEATGLDYGSVTSSAYNREWKEVSKTLISSDQMTSSKYWQQNRPVSPWEFSEWIVGPPPTETNVGALQREKKQEIQGSRWFTEKQMQSWTLDWKETKCE